MLGNTPVYLPIERLQVGDVVVSRNEYSGATEYKTIVGVTKKTAQTLVTLHLADAATGKEVQVVQATPEHPFRVFARGWVRAGQLGIGTSIVTRAGPALVVIAIEHQERAEGYSVYNLTVDQDHTYFVGAAQGGTWVHNSGECDASSMQSLDLSNPAWRQSKFTQDGLVYLLKDASTGSILKVGQTSAKKFIGRFEKYVTAGARNNRHLSTDVFETPLTKRGKIEGEIRRNLGKRPGSLPWDNTGRRLGRSGPGVP